MLQENKFDLYLNGHEHVITYAYLPHSQVPEVSMIEYSPAYLSNNNITDYKCAADQESFFGNDPH